MYFQYETERLLLMVLDENRAADVVRFYLEGDSFFGSVEPVRPEGFYTDSYQKRMLKYEMEGFITQRHARYYVFKKEDPNRIIGTISLLDIKRGSFCTAGIGYKFLKEYTGKGYGTEAVQRVVEAAFKEGGLHRITAHVQPGNMDSRKLLMRIGFEEEGLEKAVIRINGRWTDHIRYACINKEENHGGWRT